MSTKVSEAGKGGTGGKSSWSIGMDDAPDDRFGTNNKVGNAPKPSVQQTQQLPSEQKKEEAVTQNLGNLEPTSTTWWGTSTTPKDEDVNEEEEAVVV